jgi:hypothetical protein
MSKFLTKQRRLIFVCSAGISAITLFCAELFDHTSLLGGFLVNLSASAVTIGATVIFIDYLLSAERKDRMASARSHAHSEIQSMKLHLAGAIAILFREYELKDVSEKVDPDSIDFVAPTLKRVGRAIEEKQVLTPKFRLHKKDVEHYTETVGRSVQILDRITDTYRHALSEDEQDMIFRFYPTIKAAEACLAAYSHMVEYRSKDAKANARLRSGGQEIVKMTAHSLYESLRDSFYTTG